MKQSKKSDPLFAIAADNYRNDVLSLRKAGTFKEYSRAINKLILYFGHMRVSTIERQHIQRYIVFLNNTAGPSSVSLQLIMFKGVMQYADEDWGMPRVYKPKSRKPKREAYSFEEVRKLLKHTDGPLKTLIMLLAETGMRLGEALALRSGDVENGTISITKNVYNGLVQDCPKTDSSVRKIHISNLLDKHLKAFTTSDKKKFLFAGPNGRPQWPQVLTYGLMEVCKQAGVPYKAFHAFRRGNVTELILNLLVPEKIVGYRIGHLSDSITLGVYCQVAVGSDKPWIEKIEQALYLTN